MNVSKFVPGDVLSVHTQLTVFKLGFEGDIVGDLHRGDIILTVGEERCKGDLFTIVFSPRFNSLVSVFHAHIVDCVDVFV